MRNETGQNTPKSIKTRDEDYAIDLCDEVLNLRAVRQHRIEFLRGDAGTLLPVDAYYPSLRLVIEYHERQHSERVPLFDGRMTVSGVTRDEQRKRYDELRRRLLPEHAFDLVEITYDQFAHDGRKRLKRNKPVDLEVVKRLLSRYIK